MGTIGMALFAYLVGSIAFAVVVSRAMGLADPRNYGSGNPGATNVLRSGEKAAAALTLLGDAGKGWLAVFVAQLPGLNLSESAVALSVLCVFAGHVYPVFFRFRGGKGVATALGVLLALNPLLGLATLATWLLAAGLWKISSLAALIAAGSAPVYAILMLESALYQSAVLALALWLVWRHHSNIRHLLQGTEEHIGSG
ncbi:MAG: glycerol-3-phosphate 1-O-acyltransferase PlsY [Burkholderiales bacterium]